jgi:hypothetical protein
MKKQSDLKQNKEQKNGENNTTSSFTTCVFFKQPVIK